MTQYLILISNLLCCLFLNTVIRDYGCQNIFTEPFSCFNLQWAIPFQGTEYRQWLGIRMLQYTNNT